MKESKVSIRYAKALLQISIEKGLLKESYNDMLLIDSVCSENKNLINLLKSPIIKTDKKIKILEQIFVEKLGDLSMNFINIITSKKREVLLAEIASSFILLYKENNNIKPVTVTTAIPLTDKLKKEVIGFIKKYNAKDIELTEKVDEKIIGGAIIRMGDKQLDASISSEITELRKMFNKNLCL